MKQAWIRRAGLIEERQKPEVTSNGGGLEQLGWRCGTNDHHGSVGRRERM